jgi:hypothetical protein
MVTHVHPLALSLPTFLFSTTLVYISSTSDSVNAIMWRVLLTLESNFYALAGSLQHSSARKTHLRSMSWSLFNT